MFLTLLSIRNELRFIFPDCFTFSWIGKDNREETNFEDLSDFRFLIKITSKAQEFVSFHRLGCLLKRLGDDHVGARQGV